MQTKLKNKMEKLHGHTLIHWKKNAEKDYSKVPISVLKYIICLEEKIKQLTTHAIVGQNEQLACPNCNSTNILSPDKDNDAQCIECAFVWSD